MPTESSITSPTQDPPRKGRDALSHNRQRLNQHLKAACASPKREKVNVVLRTRCPTGGRNSNVDDQNFPPWVRSYGSSRRRLLEKLMHENPKGRRRLVFSRLKISIISEGYPSHRLEEGVSEEYSTTLSCKRNVSLPPKCTVRYVRFRCICTHACI